MLKLWTNLTFFQTKTLNIYKNVKFNDYFLFNGQSTVPIRHSKIVKNEIIMKDWQCFVESVIQVVKGDKNHLKPLPKSEKR